MIEDDRTSRIEKELFLRSMSIGRIGAVAEVMASRMKSRSFETGELLYREGEASSDVFFLMRGTVELRTDGEDPWTFRDRDVVGVLDVMQDRPRARTAVATSDTRALVVAADDWFDLLEDNFEVTRRAIVNQTRGIHELGLRLAPTGGFPVPEPDDTDERPIQPLDVVARIITLRDIPLLGKANVQPLTGLAKVLEEIRLEAGERLWRRGDSTDSFHLCVRGLIEIAREDPLVRAGFGPGAIVGGYGSLGAADQAFDAQARVPSQVFRIRQDDYFDLMEDHFELARSVLAEIARVRERLMMRLAQRSRMGREAVAEVPAAS